MRRDNPNASRFPVYGWAGLLIIILSEILLFSGNDMVGRWFTPIVWTGYILLIDGLVYRNQGRSLLMNNRIEFLIISVISMACWWLFEFYNEPRFWRSGADDVELWWHYRNLEPNLFLRRAGYDWAFATIFPALFETAELITAKLPVKAESRQQPTRIPAPLLYAMVLAGGVISILPFIYISPWLVPLVWAGILLLLDPLNALRGWPSICGDISTGNWRRLTSLVASGAVCGFLWEFWNYWAVTKWTYTVPYLGDIKLFEMPVLGYLGFLPFAVECWAMYIFLRSLLGYRPLPSGSQGSRIVVDLQ